MQFNGKIMISSRLSQVDCTFTNVMPTMKINLSEKNKEYLEYHRKKIFAWNKKTRSVAR